MHELFILSKLLEESQTGYQLHSAMQNTLGPHREISFGILYPLLDKMQQADYIGVKKTNLRGKKLFEILPVGKKRFIQLMIKPISSNAHTEDLFLIKINAMRHVRMEDQLNLLDQYLNEQHQIIMEIEKEMRALKSQDLTNGHRYAYKVPELRLTRANATIQWLLEYKDELISNTLSE